jgi:uncharacterized protein YbjT (DUF2867 family)
MTVLVTKATGTVGHEVVRALSLRGVPVSAFVRESGRRAQRLVDEVELASHQPVVPGQGVGVIGQHTVVHRLDSHTQ